MPVTLLAWMALSAAFVSVASTTADATLAAVPGIKVGHHTLTERPTGCTVVLIEAGATPGVDVRGAAPATRDTDLLHPTKMVGAELAPPRADQGRPLRPSRF